MDAAAIDRAHSAALSHHLASLEASGCHAQLRDEFIGALIAGPETVIATPDSATSSQPIADVIYDAMSSREGDRYWHELMRLFAALVDGKGGPVLALKAGALAAEMAVEHADWHAAAAELAA